MSAILLEFEIENLAEGNKSRDNMDVMWRNNVVDVLIYESYVQIF